MLINTQMFCHLQAVQAQMGNHYCVVNLHWAPQIIFKQTAFIKNVTDILLD